MNTYNVQTMLDGPRNTVVKVDISLDGASGDFTVPTVLVDPQLLSSSGPANGPPPRKVRVDDIDWDVQDGLSVNLWWQGAGNSAPIWRMVGRSREKAFHAGGLQNNADQPTGRITFTTTSTSLNAPLVATFKLHCVKQP